MNNIDDGGPAFPVYGLKDANDRVVCFPQSGMSLREYFMAHAPITVADAVRCCGWRGPPDWNDANRATVMSVLALMRREYADAMMAERNKS
jgi:hypothetical protein